MNRTLLFSGIGGFDISKQKELAEKFERLEDIKKSISDELDKISNTEIDFDGGEI